VYLAFYDLFRKLGFINAKPVSSGQERWNMILFFKKYSVE
jgi:hypothetical protein